MEKDAVGYPFNGHTNPDIRRYLASRLPYRELIRAGRRGGLDRLDNLARKTGFLPVTTAVWRRAAELWAQARNEGYATADDSALDCDVILAAQALLVAEDGFEVIVATRNAGHLGRFVDAREWQTITTDRPGGMPLP